jgi:uncharacterized protein
MKREERMTPEDMRFIYRRFYSPLSRLYVLIRERILLYKEIEFHTPKEGLIYDLGCGYGLLSYYLGITSEKRKIIGFDFNKTRVNAAKEAFDDMSNITFSTEDLSKSNKLKRCSCIILYDILHHISYNNQKRLLETCKRFLQEEGILIIKEIDNKKKFKLFYTWLLDKIVTKGDKLYFSGKKELVLGLKGMGFSVSSYDIDKYCPYPHYIIVARKDETKG